MCVMHTRACRAMTRSFGFIAPATSTRPRRTGTSANTPIGAAPRACSIFWMRNAATAPFSSDTGKSLRHTPRLSSSYAKPWARGVCHDHTTGTHTGISDSSRRPARRRTRWMRRAASERDDVLLRAAVEIGYARTFHDSARPDVACTSGHRRTSKTDAHAAPDRQRRLQRIQNHACDYAGRRAGEPDSRRTGREGEAGPADAASDQPGLLAAS